MYSFRITTGPVDLAFTDRVGGVSAAPFDALNLARDGEDAVEDRAENLRLLIDDFAPGDVVADLRQVHGATVVLADDAHRTSYDEAPEGDGIVSVTPGVTLMVRAADCVPVLMADPQAQVIGAAHAGRLGMVSGVVPATIARMRELGAQRITAWVGPHICGACYEVPVALQAEVATRVPASLATTSWGTPALDIGAGVRAQLAAEDIEVVDAGRCTHESPDLYSYRRDGAGAGRQAGIIRLGGAR